jgi:polyisoprenoid-binding protein YceI
MINIKTPEMKKSILTLLVICTTYASQAQLYSSTQSVISFFSKTPVEDIKAESKEIKALVNVQTRDIAFLVANTSFQFENKLMQEHFNEKYMESEKYPMSTFKGKIIEEVDLTKDGIYNVNVTGKLNLHGVEKDRNIPGVVTVKNGVIHIASDFKVQLAAHQIQVPKLVVAKIAEEIDVKVDASLALKK